MTISILELLNLKKYFGEVKAVDEVTLNFKKGKITSLIGANGAGKSTLANLVSGVLSPDSGRIIFEGEDITDYSLSKRAELGIVKSFQVPLNFPELTVHEAVSAAVASKLEKSSKFFLNPESDDEVTKETEEILKGFGLYEKKNHKCSNLPEGDKKILDIATALALTSKFLLLDEPTSGVSTAEKIPTMDRIISMSEDIGVESMLVIEHDMDIVYSYSDRVLVMNEGKIIADGEPEEIRKSQSRGSLP